MDTWTREQTIIALSVYCRIPFNKALNTHPEIVSAAKLIGRSPSAVKMKVGNFGSFDPELKARGIVGLTNSSKMDEAVWNEYCNDWERLAYDSEIIRTKFEAETYGIKSLPTIQEREAIVKQRISQAFFRTAVLSSYDNRCCISGLSCIDLLEACHIVGWAANIENRLNPSNGICLNTLFHKAYDMHYIGITPDYKVMISERLFDGNTSDSGIYTFFRQYHGIKIRLPNKFMPSKELLYIHHQRFIS